MKRIIYKCDLCSLENEKEADVLPDDWVTVRINTGVTALAEEDRHLCGSCSEAVADVVDSL